MEVQTRMSFSAAHFLPRVPLDHQCRRIHGHTYLVSVTVTGAVDREYGWVMDFGDLKSILGDVVRDLDHTTLNDIPGLENPTTENLVNWFVLRLGSKIPGLAVVTVREGHSNRCTWRASERP